MQKFRQSCQNKVPHLRPPIDVKVSWAQVFPGIQRVQICETQPACQGHLKVQCDGVSTCLPTGHDRPPALKDWICLGEGPIS